ncbi:uncharacterized protein VNE69_07066 [Vairimorpha necatrix]|uniref:Uncharacterized protein n=1 Tax=Vairimorpha necatrix TaxID=6039 RepID=A0AAX4JDG4_9MICR
MHKKKNKHEREELECLYEIERKIQKKSKIFKASEQYHLSNPSRDAVKNLQGPVQDNDLLCFDVIYDLNRQPIARIDFLKILENSNRINKLKRPGDTQALINQEDTKELKDPRDFNRLSTEEKIIELRNINSIFEKSIDENFHLENKHAENMIDDKNNFVKYAAEKSFDALVSFASKYTNLDLQDIKLQEINVSIEIMPNIKISSPSLFLFLKSKEITPKLFYKIYNKISSILNPSFIIDLLYVNISDYKIFQIKEYYKLYSITGQTDILKYLTGDQNKLLVGKVLFYMGKYLEGYLLLRNTKNILKYKLEYYLNYEKCVRNLREDIYSYKHFLLFVWIKQQNRDTREINQQSRDTREDILNLYKEAVEKYKNIPCKLAYLRYQKMSNNPTILYEDTLNDEIYYENYIITRKSGGNSYKYLSKFKKKLVKKNINWDLLEQEMCYLENKTCKLNNKYYYLYKYKSNRKTGKEDFEIVNGDSLIIMYIYNININIIKAVYNINNYRNGLYWSRTRNIQDFKKRLDEAKEIFQYDQDY